MFCFSWFLLLGRITKYHSLIKHSKICYFSSYRELPTDLQSSKMVSPNAVTQQISESDSDVCHTKVNFRKTNYLWIIDDYRRVHDRRGTSIKSLPFPADDEFKWHMTLNPKCDNAGSISLHLCIDNVSSFTQYAPTTGHVKFSIVNAENQATKTQNVEFTFNVNVGSGIVGYTNFVNKNFLFDEANKVLPQDRLVIACDVSYIKKTDVVNVPGLSFSTPHENKERQSSSLEDIGTLFMDKEFADVTLCINGKDYHAHKGILAARSSVFKAMLRSDMSEKKSNRIEINDIDESVFIEMLRYIYTGKPENLEIMVPELLEAADKYDLEKLKIICETELLKNVSKENVVEVLILADRHNAKNLKTEVVRYIKMNSYNTNILTKEVRKNLVTSHPHLLLEILDAFSKTSVEEN